MNHDDDSVLLERLAKLPRTMEPSRDLWPDIAARLQAEGAPTAQGAGPRQRYGGLGIAAAAALVAAGLLITLKPVIESPAVTVPSGGAQAVVVSVDPGVQLASESLLDSMTLKPGGDLSPEAIAVVRENLHIIDQALKEIAAALELDPENTQLQRQLLDTYSNHAQIMEHLIRAQNRNEARTDI